MKTFILSDSHFCHTNIIRLCSRPFSGEDKMNHFMVAAWNKVVGPRDKVYFLGDFAFKGSQTKSKEWFDKLNGHKILIKGNHDKGHESMRNVGFSEVHDQLEIELFGQKILLCHYPYKPQVDPNDVPEYEVKHLNLRPEYRNQILFHGHIHNEYRFRKNMVNFSAEVWNYTPVDIERLEEVVSLLSNPVDKVEVVLNCEDDSALNYFFSCTEWTGGEIALSREELVKAGYPNLKPGDKVKAKVDLRAKTQLGLMPEIRF